MENKEKFKKLLQDEEFVTKLLEMQTREEVQEELKKQGIDVSLEEVGELGGIINYMIKEEKTQLSEDDLKNISGGDYDEAIIKVLGGDKITNQQEHAGLEKGLVESRIKKWGELEVIALTAVIAIPVTVGVTKLATWGIDRLIKKLDEKIDGKKSTTTK